MSILFPVFAGIAQKASVQEEWKRTLVSTLSDILPWLVGLFFPPWLSIIKNLIILNFMSSIQM